MLVILSDLHLTDGTCGSSLDERAFRIFRHRLSDLAYDASWRANGRYKPLESLDIILLGDILDPLRSARWLHEPENEPGSVRPWDDVHSPHFSNKVNAISRAILDSNAGSLNILKTLTNTLTIPPATAAGQPAKVGWEFDAPGRLPLEIRLHYLVGNHDWFYHLPGEVYNGIRQDIIKAIGLSNTADPFPHALAESESLHTLCCAYNVFARHGDIFDAFNYDSRTGRDTASLGDAVVLELINRFPNEVARRLGEQLPLAGLERLKEIDKVRPVWVIPLWLNGYLNRTCPSAQQIKQVKNIWDELVDRFLAIPFVRRQNTLNPLERIDALELALKFSKGGTFPFIRQLLRWLSRGLDSDTFTYYQDALAEPVFKEQSAQFIVHGHTHHYEVVPLHTCLKSDGSYPQMYLNSGTWRPVYELNKTGAGDEFIGYQEMSYLAFFKDDERGGTSFETWSGRLGPAKS